MGVCGCFRPKKHVHARSKTIRAQLRSTSDRTKRAGARRGPNHGPSPCFAEAAQRRFDGRAAGYRPGEGDERDALQVPAIPGAPVKANGPLGANGASGAGRPTRVEDCSAGWYPMELGAVPSVHGVYGRPISEAGWPASAELGARGPSWLFDPCRLAPASSGSFFRPVFSRASTSYVMPPKCL